MLVISYTCTGADPGFSKRGGGGVWNIVQEKFSLMKNAIFFFYSRCSVVQSGATPGHFKLIFVSRS